ncbi:MAG: hypothetical protein QM744_10990 [Mesorhizobium sp.]
MTVAGKSFGNHKGCAVEADAEGSAGKDQPPAAGQARYRLALVRAAGGHPFQRRCVFLPVSPVAAKKLEGDAAPVEAGQFLLELRRSPVVQRLHDATSHPITDFGLDRVWAGQDSAVAT